MDAAIKIGPFQKNYSLPAAFLITAFATSFTILAGACGTKYIALKWGAQGIASLGTYRTFIEFVVCGLGLGYGEILCRNSRQQTPPSALAVLSSLQLLVTTILIVLGASALSIFLDQNTHTVRSLLISAFCITCFQNSLAVMRGRSLLRAVTQLQVFAACVSLIYLFGFSSEGPANFPIYLGIGSLAGIGIVSHSLFAESFSGVRSRQTILIEVRALIANLRSSMAFFVRTVVASGSSLLLQISIQKIYGQEVLANFNAAHLVFGILIAILTSSLYAKLLPELARAQDTSLSKKLFNTTAVFLVSITLITSTLAILSSKYLMTFFFSKDFIFAPPLFAALSIYLLGLVYSYILNTLFLHLGKVWLGVILDCAVFLGWVGLIWSCGRLSISSETIPRYFALYGLGVSFLYCGLFQFWGRAWVTWRTTGLVCLALLWLAFLFFQMSAYVSIAPGLV